MVLLSGPNMGGNVWEYVKECLDTGWVSSVGAYVDRFEKMTAAFTGSRYAVATSSGTTALHISLLLAGVRPGDWVITPNITFVATCNAVCYTGARPLLMDTEAGDWQMDLDLLEDFLRCETEIRDGVCHHRSSGTRIPVLLPVHVLGNLCDMDRLLQLAVRHGLTVVEDSTEALGSYYKGRHAGTFGILGTFSYNGNKIITTGGGGMIVTDDEALARKAKHLTTQAKSDPFEYIHDEVGYNYRLTNVAAAMGVAQMEQLPDFIIRKKEIMAFYRSRLEGLGDIRFQSVAADVDPNCWMPTLFTVRQRELLRALNDNQLQSRPFWVPMNQLPMFSQDLYIHRNDCSDHVYRHALSIPCSTYITDADLERVVTTVRGIFEQS